MANLPLSSQADSLDSLTVTREQFRLQQSDLLEFLAQALGNVSGDYTTQAVNPTGVVLQGTPTLAVGAEPTAVDDSLRLACTRWVRRNSVSAGAVAPLNPVRGQVWVDIGSDPPAIKVWDDTPGSGSWVTLGLVPDATTTTKGIVQLADAAAITAGTAGRVVDAAQLQAAANKSGLATDVAVTGLASVTFTGIPSWAKKITVMCYGVSTSDTNPVVLQVGSGSLAASGYAGQVWTSIGGQGVAITAIPLFAVGGSAGYAVTGVVVLTKLRDHIWMANGQFGYYNVTSNGWHTTGFTPSLSGPLDRVAILPASGGLFDNGNINILYEG